MPTPTPPELTPPPTPPSRTDPENFPARGDAFLSWFPTAWSNMSDAMAWVYARTLEVLTGAETATTKAGEALSSANAAATSETNAAGSKNLAQDWATKPSGEVATGQGYSAKKYAGDADTSRQLAQQWATKTDAEVVPTQGFGAKKYAQDASTSAGAAAGSAAQALGIYGSVDAQQTSVAQAAAQAALAAGYAASASSVVQQDLSGVTAQALHRSPNAITAMFIYDVSVHDSDGGAHIEREQAASWYGEALNGKWLGAAASEAAARAISGAATGDYFNLSTDGKPYKLNSGSGITEVSGGNTPKRPRLSALVCEAGSLNIYDLTQPGRPLWKRFPTTGVLAVGNITGVSAAQGMIFVTGSLGLATINFAGDFVRVRTSTTVKRQEQIATRATNALLNEAGNTSTIVNSDAKSVAATILPDAPVDVATGLPVPTIAVMTAGGVSVIRHDGTVASHAFTFSTGNDVAALLFTAGYLLYGNSANNSGFRFIRVSGISGPTFTGVASPGSSVFTGVIPASLSGRLNTVQAMRKYNQAQADLFRLNAGSNAGSIHATITDKFNTGYMAGDIRRCYMASVTAESIGPVSELAQAANYGVPATSDNTLSGVTDSSFTAVGNTTITRSYLNVTLVVGKTYQLVFRSVDKTINAYLYTAASAGGSNTALVLGAASGVTQRLTFTATATGQSLVFAHSTNGTSFSVDSISVKEVVSDRSYKQAGANIFGTLTKTPVAAGAQLVMYSGWSAANYLQEPYSADLDFGTGEWSFSVPMNIPVTLPVSSFPVIGAETWNDATVAFSGSSSKVSAGVYRIYTPDGSSSTASTPTSVTAGKVYKVTFTIDSVTTAGGGVVPDGVVTNGQAAVSAPGTYSFLVAAGTTNLPIKRNGTSPVDIQISGVTIKEVGPAIFFDRSAATGPSIQGGLQADGKLIAIVNDGTTTRTVTTSAAYNTGTTIKPRVNYRAGKLSINVNGREVAATVGAPLLTLNNSNAVLTKGISRALDAPFPGGLALLKIGASVPTDEQALWMYEQEKALFQPGANCVLPDSGAVVDLAYDEQQDKWVAVSAANESSWTGLVRTATAAASAGSITGVRAQSGVKLMARSTTSPGVDVTIPAYGLREELVRRAEKAAAIAKNVTVFDFDAIGFTATTANTSKEITSVSVTNGTPYVGMGISGAGIPAGTTITAINGATYQLSANATATATGVTIGQTDFTLPAGYTASGVMSGGTRKREGSTKDWTRLYDGFREAVRFGTSPGSATWVQISATKE